MSPAHATPVLAGAACAEDLAGRIEIARRKAATPGYDLTVDVGAVDVEAFNRVGDPLAEALIVELRERGLIRDLMAGARELRHAGVPAAVDFFAEVEHVPSWADFEAMRIGAAMAKRHPIGLLMSAHGGFPFTYVDPATVRVMQSTGRMTRWSKDFERRFWETATGFVGALDVDGMMPGGRRWEQWVRIRFLHTIIRLEVLRTGRWDVAAGMPISQTATAAGAWIFGRYRVNLIRSLGGVVTEPEADGFSLMWRWISRLQGANAELLGSTVTAERQIQQRIHQYLYAPDASSRAGTEVMIDGLSRMKTTFPFPRRLHVAVARRVLAESVVETLPGRNLPRDLGLPIDPAADAALAAAVAGLRVASRLGQRPRLARYADRHGQAVLDRVVDRGLHHRQADYRPTRDAGVDTPAGRMEIER